MRRQSRRRYYSDYGREGKRRLPNPLPYLLVFIIAIGGLVYFRLFTYKSLSGSVANAYTGDPMSGIPVTLMQTGDPLATPAVQSRVVMTATTGPKGDFSFSRVPARPAISVTVEGYAAQVIETGEAGSLNVELVPNTLSGVIVDPSGNPIVAAHVRVGDVAVRSGAD